MQEITQHYLELFSSWLNYNQVQNDGEMVINTKGNIMVYFMPHHNNQFQFYIQEEMDAMECFIKERYSYDLSSFDVRKEDETNYLFIQ